MFDEVDRAAQVSDPDVATRIFADMKSRYPRATFTQQAGLVAAPRGCREGKLDDAQASLAWVADNAGEKEYRAIARLRLAGLLLDAKKYDEALKQVDGIDAPTSPRSPPIAAATSCWRKARTTTRRPRT